MENLSNQKNQMVNKNLKYVLNIKAFKVIMLVQNKKTSKNIWMSKKSDNCNKPDKNWHNQAIDINQLKNIDKKMWIKLKLKINLEKLKNVLNETI